MVVAFHRALIIVPTYNERDNVAEVATHFLAPLDDAEILFIDDNSPDGTGQRIDALAADSSRVHVLHRAGKLGLGTAYLEGFAWGLARHYDYILEMDADFSHDPKYLPTRLERAATDADMVVGSRYVSGGGTENWGIGRQLISRAGGFYARKILGVRIRDLTSGFACYRRSTLEAIDLSAISSNGYGFQIEMKYRVHLAGLNIVEIPIVFSDRRVGESKMSTEIMIEAMWKVWGLRFGSR